ncbi:MAG TPA: polysaccharide biosynthesis/export family protein [Vicinamibacteria bacterium]|nr:polysaccharide biosynthesis/export family protein [Vicinamibacteria bacterium]
MWGVLAGLLLSGIPAGRAQDAKASTAPAQGPQQDYRIGAGDVLQLFVWKEPDLSRDVTVRFDGKVTIPLLGDVTAAGETPQKLADAIATRLQRFLTAPQVTIGVGQATSARFHVLGQVGKPGDFPLTRPTTVLQGLALAGGFKDFAKSDSIVIIRDEGQGQTSIPVNYKKLEAGHDLSQNILLRPGDTILVP